MAEDLGLDAWWDEFEYRRCSATLDLRGEFVLRKLREHDAAKLQIVECTMASMDARAVSAAIVAAKE